MAVKYTEADVAALCEIDVVLAKLRAAEAREMRRGVGTIDFVLSQVGGRQTLAQAKAYLLAQLYQGPR